MFSQAADGVLKPHATCLISSVFGFVLNKAIMMLVAVLAQLLSYFYRDMLLICRAFSTGTHSVASRATSNSKGGAAPSGKPQAKVQSCQAHAQPSKPAVKSGAADSVPGTKVINAESTRDRQHPQVLKGRQGLRTDTVSGVGSVQSKRGSATKRATPDVENEEPGNTNRHTDAPLLAAAAEVVDLSTGNNVVVDQLTQRAVKKRQSSAHSSMHSKRHRLEDARQSCDEVVDLTDD